MDGVELTYLERSPIDPARAVAQHAAYEAALTASAIPVHHLPALPGHPDCAFVEDVAVSLPECIVLCRPGAESRQGEVASVAAALPDDRPRYAIASPGTIDGGDVLTVGRTLHVGRSHRTSDAAIRQLAGIVATYGYRVEAVEVRGALHLKTAVTAPAEGVLVANRRWVSLDAFDAVTVVEVPETEPFGANTLPVGKDRALVHSGAPVTAERLSACGVDVTCVDIGEFGKAEAGLTCLSIVVPAVA